MHDSNVILDTAVEPAPLTLSTNRVDGNLSAENNNQPNEFNWLTIWENSALDCLAQFDKIVSNTWQNCTFADEIVHNHVKNYIILQRDNIDAYIKTQPADVAQWVGKNFSYTLKQILLINEQTLLDSLNYIAIPASKQARHFWEASINNISKHIHPN